MAGTALDPTAVLSDPQIRTFSRNQRADLLAADTPILSSGVFVIYRNTTKKGQIEIVHYIAPYAMERTDVGTPNESFRTLAPVDADGFFAFTPRINGQPGGFILEADLNAPRTAAAPGNTERQRRGAITNLSPTPWVDSNRFNPLFSIPLPSDTEFTVSFELLPVALTSPIPNPFSIGAGAVKRVDFAGVIVSGVVMPQHLYDKLLTKQMNQSAEHE